MIENAMTEVFKFLLESPVTTKGLLLLFVGIFYWRDKTYLKAIKRELKLLSHKQSATNYALEKSFKNGYKDYYDSEMDKLIEEDKYLA